MSAREIRIDGAVWRVLPSGFLTGSVADEHGLIFVTGYGSDVKVRFTRYSPVGTRSRERALAEMDDSALKRLFEMTQPSMRSPEGGYRT